MGQKVDWYDSALKIRSMTAIMDDLRRIEKDLRFPLDPKKREALVKERMTLSIELGKHPEYASGDARWWQV